MAKGKAADKIKTTADLRKALLETIQGVRSGEVDHKQGATVAVLAKAVIASAKLDLEALRFQKELELPGTNATVKAIELAK